MSDRSNSPAGNASSSNTPFVALLAQKRPAPSRGGPFRCVSTVCIASGSARLQGWVPRGVEHLRIAGAESHGTNGSYTDRPRQHLGRHENVTATVLPFLQP